MARSRIINLEGLTQFTAINLLVDPGHLGGPIVIPNGVQVVLTWALDGGKTGKNVLYGSVGGGFSPSTTIANAIMSGLTTGGSWTAYAAQLAPLGGLQSVSLRDVRTANQPIITSTGGAAAGTGAAPMLPNEVAACLTLRTGGTGQQNRGRMFLCGFSTITVAAGNVIAGATMTAINNWSAIIAGVLAGNGLTWSIGHPARAGYTGITGTAHPARAAGLVPITTIAMRDNHWDSQRRRGLK